MTPNRPYFIRAIYEWILDNNCTPFLAVNAKLPLVEVPQEYVQDGEIILNMDPSAIVSLQIENEFIMFSARFKGVSRDIVVPMNAVLGIYAKENGQGMAFPEKLPIFSEAVKTEQITDTPKPASKPTLTVVK